MTIRPRVVRAVRAARIHLRDVAAAEHMRRQTEAEMAERDRQSAAQALATRLAAAPNQLANATSVSQVIRVINSVDVEREDVARFAANASQAHVQTAEAAQQLRDRERAVRTIDRVADQMREAKAHGEAKAEQAASDDLAARNRPL